jgi:hypothetical protein
VEWGGTVVISVLLLDPSRELYNFPFDGQNYTDFGLIDIKVYTTLLWYYVLGSTYKLCDRVWVWVGMLQQLILIFDWRGLELHNLLYVFAITILILGP